MIASHLQYPVKFTSNELRTNLKPIIYKMINSEYYSFILYYPEESQYLKNISIIHKKLISDEYKNPLEFCDDIWNIFNNAFNSLKQTTLIYQIYSKLAELFSEVADSILKNFGYCCARQYVYAPNILICGGNQLNCKIELNENYYYYKNSDKTRFNLSYDEYRYCINCFNSIKNDKISIGDDQNKILYDIPKTLFSLTKNNQNIPELMINCIICTRRWHKVCALHINSHEFICPTCLFKYNIKPKENLFNAQNLPKNDLSYHLEKHVNNYLLKQNSSIGQITIRVLADNDHLCQINSQIKNFYSNKINNNYPYRNRGIFAFEKIDNIDVIFFGMYVQEYDEHCPQPNTRRVYISFIDTIKFNQLNIEQEILIGYLDYIKQHGYNYAHIWTCPATKQFNDIFYRNPFIMKLNTLRNWCKNMLNKATEQGIIVNYKNILQDCLDNKIETVMDIPYFDGDFWPNTIEQCIIEHTYDLHQYNNTYEKQNFEIITNNSKLLSLIFSEMDKYKESFFVIHLHNELTTHPTNNDNNNRIHYDLMDTRHTFLNFTANQNYEFSSLRHAKYSTMAILYELYTSTITNQFTYYCNKCLKQCQICYYCTVCEDFDLCDKCYHIELKHEHNMERRIFN